MAEYRLTPAAERDLESIWTYTVQQRGFKQANCYIDFLTAAFAELAESPITAQPVSTFGQTIAAGTSSGT